MSARAPLSMTILLQGLGPAQAHVPAGTVLGIWQWPLEALPVMDGDLSEWEVVPDSLWLDLNTLDADGNPLFWARDWEAQSPAAGRYGTEADPADLTMRFAIGWNDETDRLYFAQQRHDDLFDRRDSDEPISLCVGHDGVDVHVDADHSGLPNAECYSDFGCDIIYDRGRSAQQALFLFPSISVTSSYLDWHWMWMSSATWHDKEPYSCCPDAYTLEGEHGAEGVLIAEWWSVYYNDLDHDSPANSVQAELSEGQIIGMGIAFCDDDLGTSEDRWATGGRDGSAWWKESDYLSDWILLPVSDYWTGIEHTSWGQVKASFTP